MERVKIDTRKVVLFFYSVSLGAIGAPEGRLANLSYAEVVRMGNNGHGVGVMQFNNPDNQEVERIRENEEEARAVVLQDQQKGDVYDSDNDEQDFPPQNNN